MMESGSCISTATFIQIITKSPSSQFAGWGDDFFLAPGMPFLR